MTKASPLNPTNRPLERMEGRYRGILEAAPDAMVVVDQAGLIVLVNAQAETQFGYPRYELLGQAVVNIIPTGFAERLISDDLRSTADAVAQQIGTGIELIGRRKDNSEFPIEIMLSPLESTDGILVTAAIRNISVRKAAELHLARMESRYRGLLEAAPDAMVVVDQDGKIVLVNAQAERRFGYSRDELLGQLVTSIIPTGFAERLVADDLRSSAEALAQNIGTGIELTGRRKDDSTFPIEIMLSPLASADSVLVTAAIRDISVRKDAEQNLVRMESRYRGLLEAAPDAMVVVDPRGKIVLVNAQAETQFGYSRDELLGRLVTSIIPTGFAERLVADDLRSSADALAQNIGTGIELTARRKDNSTFPIEIMLSPLESADEILVTAAIRNITVRKAAERQIVESKRVLEDLFENSDAAIVDRDFSGVFRAVQSMKRKGVRDLRTYIAQSAERFRKLVDVMGTNGANAAALRMFGVTSPQELHRQETIIVDVAEAIFYGVANIKRSEYLTTNLTPISVLYSLRVPKTEDEARRVPIIIIDLSNVRLAEAARQATVAKSQFLSSMSHEIRTPLNGLIGNLELLASTHLDDEQLELIDDADKAAKALLGLVCNILDFSKIEAGKLATEMSDINPAALVEEAVDVLQSRARQKRIFISSTFSPDVPLLVRGDAARVRQILLNLIGNAVKFTDEGGVQVDLVVRRWNGDMCDLRFTVYDSGRGFDDVQKARLFEPFTQDHSPIDGLEGTGLGLSICKSLVDAFGGTIECRATPNEGATFSFTLPVSVVRRADPSIQADLSGVRALVVGRAEGPRTVLEDYFKTRGAIVLAGAEGPDDALALLDTLEKISPIDVAALIPEDGEDTGETARRLRTQEIVPLLYGDEYSARARLRRGFAGMIPDWSTAQHLDRNIKLLLGSVKTRPRTSGQKTALESAISLDIRGKRVLVLEDRLVNQVVIRKQLLKLGIEATLAVDGVKGLEALDRGTFDIILCDCSMPVMNGYQFTRALRQREASSKAPGHIPVIALTANAFQEDVDRCIQSGMDDFMSKPVTMDRLSAMLGRWLKTGTKEPSSQVSARANTLARPASTLSIPAIDLSGLTEIMGSDDPEPITQVLAAFLATAGTSLAYIEEALASGDRKRIKAATHGAKGDARNASATALADIYAELESRNKDGDQAASQALATSAALEVRRVEDFIREHLKAVPLAKTDDASASVSQWGRS